VVNEAKQPQKLLERKQHYQQRGRNSTPAKEKCLTEHQECNYQHQQVPVAATPMKLLLPARTSIPEAVRVAARERMKADKKCRVVMSS
jgi:hypothetical protein